MKSFLESLDLYPRYVKSAPKIGLVRNVLFIWPYTAAITLVVAVVTTIGVLVIGVSNAVLTWAFDLKSREEIDVQKS